MPEDTDINKIPSFDSLPSEDLDTANALDQALLEATEGAGDPQDKPVDEVPDKPADEKPADEKPADEKPADEKPADEKPAVEKDDLDTVELSPYTKPKTAEAFDTVKRIAREKIAALDTRAKELEAKNKELEEKTKSLADGMTPEVKKELEELRTFRKRLDVEADPEFKSFDARVEANTTTIYDKLAAAGASKETIEKIKSLGGPNGVDWEPILARLPSVTRRVIESKLVENDELVEKKTKAIEDAKKNADEFLKTRASQTENQRKDLQTRAEKQLAAMLPEFDWLKPKTAEAKASETEKATIAAHNALVKEANQYMQEAIADDSPEMRATLALAGPELFKTRAELIALKASTAAEIKKLTSDLTAANTLLEKVKKNSTSRLRTSPADGKPTKPATNETAEEALDRYAREASEAQ